MNLPASEGDSGVLAVPGWPFRCPSCDHDNPEGSNYCNQCGMPVHFRLCGQCDAINHRTADRCHKCGNSLARPMEPQREPATGPKPEKEGVADVVPPAGPVHRRRYAMRAGAAVVMLAALAVPAYVAYEDAALWHQGTVDVMGPPAPTQPPVQEAAVSPDTPAEAMGPPASPVDDPPVASTEANATPQPAPAAKKPRASAKSSARKSADARARGKGSKPKGATPSP